ncbi:hypothetical protein GCK72_015526 [Caenorhabditis remanei]|uniref:Uncharacterized protein n=1 Tax=Caenorhabditis remanei TaxID=31234 RepID=A0A6A5GWS4_CAERE|nr:hypothetical protein GCK72_015526 [Caenorhabditis remanei]KAF1759066.1 hypothetical protein GCK72_015526 [Caenorhabditis remanei]
MTSFLRQAKLNDIITLDSYALTETSSSTSSVRLVDSLKYLTMSLSAVEKASKVDSVKGDFPVLFIKEENFDYVGPIPDNIPSSVRKELVEYLAKAREQGQTKRHSRKNG